MTTPAGVTSPPGALYQQAAEFRRDLLAMQEAAADQMLAAHTEAYQEMAREYVALMARVQAAQEAGRALSPAWLYQQARLREALATTQEQIDRFAAAASATVRQAQTAAVQAGAVHSFQMGRRAVQDSGVAAAFTAINPANLEHLVGFLADGSPLDALFTGMGVDTAGQIRSALIRGIGLGKGVDWMRRQVETSLDVPRWRAETIMRTESQRVYRAVARETYMANSDVLAGWTWVAALDARVCPACLVMDGTEHPVDATLDGHPRCFPAGTLVDGPSATAATARRYEGPGVVIRTAAGVQLTSTPNHPVLTGRGWVRAGDLHVGDQVVRQAGQKGTVAVHEDDDRVPARIEQVAESLVVARGVTPVSVPVAPENFHGDGGGSQVAVVWADRGLSPHVQAAVAQPPGEHGLQGGTDPADAFATLCEREALSLGQGNTSEGGMGGLDVGAPLLRRATGDHEAVGLSTPAGGDAALLQAKVDDPTADPVPSSESIHTHAGQVVLDDLVYVETVDLACHVYNLESEEGWYTANGIVVHNCRCAMVPRTKTYDELLGLPEGSTPDSRPPVRSGKAWLEAQPEVTQRAILGRGKYEAWKAGEVTLDDLVARTSDPAWGTVRRERSLREIRTGRNPNVLPR